MAVKTEVMKGTFYIRSNVRRILVALVTYTTACAVNIIVVTGDAACISMIAMVECDRQHG